MAKILRPILGKQQCLQIIQHCTRSEKRYWSESHGYYIKRFKPLTLDFDINYLLDIETPMQLHFGEDLNLINITGPNIMRSGDSYFRTDWTEAEEIPHETISEFVDNICRQIRVDGERGATGWSLAHQDDSQIWVYDTRTQVQRSSSWSR